MKLTIEENSVSSKNQLLPSKTVKCFGPEYPSLKIAVVGNSITCHGVLESIGWFGEWGMAASAEDKDFFHLLMTDFSKKYPNTSFMRVQAADWERAFWETAENYPLQLKALEEYDADIIIFRLSENCSKENCKNHDFADGFMRLCEYFSKGGKCKILITDSFWYSPWTSPGIELAAKRFCGNPIKISDLGELDEMKALGLFKEHGVAIHPGDAGMRAIADRILERLFQVVK